MSLDDLGKFEKWSLASLFPLMIKYYNYHSVIMETSFRPDVASRIWITVTITKKHFDDEVVRPNNVQYITGQTTDIVRKRLVEFLYREHPAKQL